MALKIGKLALPVPLFLAPMAGVTDSAFRRICYECGCAYSVTEMISAKALHFRDTKTAALAKITAEEGPVAVQIFGSEPEIMAEAASLLEHGEYNGCVSTAHPVAIDINMGCPMKKIVTNGEGSALMKNPSLIYDIVKAVSSATNLPVSVKMRTGWDSEHINAIECARAAAEGGAKLICVHGRTREQLYKPPVDIKTISNVKGSLGNIPTVGNGGIYTSSDAVHMLAFGCVDGIMIGQGTFGNPWIFTEIRAMMEGKSYTPPTNAQKLELIKRHLGYMVADKGEEVAVREARHHIAWYVKGMRGASTYRGQVNYMTNMKDMTDSLQRLFEENEE